MNKGRPFNKWCHNIHKTKQQLWLMPHTISKNQFKMDHRSKYKIQNRVSLVALWLKKKKKKKIHLPMRETWVWFLVREDPTCWREAGLGATTADLEPGTRTCGSLQALEPTLSHKRSPRAATREQPPLAKTRAKPMEQQRPSTAKKNRNIFLKQ